MDETPLTDYERLRAQIMMKNNQIFQSLGLSTLASMINNRSSMSKDGVSQESGSLYDAQDSEGSEQEEVNKDSQVAKGVRKNTSNHGGNISARGPRGSKRVVATDREEAPIRVTRQRSAVTKQVPSESLTAATQDALENPNSPLQNENKIDTGILSSKSSTRVGVSSKVQELQAQLETEKQEKAKLRQEIDSLKLQAQESKSTMAKQSHEVDRLKDTIKSQAQQSEAAMAKQ
ncbi:hypothetical protein C2845_PM07G18250 [Panicum miliaceum]|uniref:Uncharacterized protein n=1 Tax=Panicum miliaceum TaxID=4540 RepID=A0A3L6SSA9_PANMI|nr:hypothetical protein C2845_PM07G18250 [Panicum miliaceum]